MEPRSDSPLEKGAWGKINEPAANVRFRPIADIHRWVGDELIQAEQVVIVEGHEEVSCRVQDQRWIKRAALPPDHC